MNFTEKKKILYKEKPIAKRMTIDHTMNGSMYWYKTQTSLGIIQFKVPRHEMGETEFGKEENSQLLIRWMI